MPLELESGRPALKLATGFETGQVANRVIRTYVCAIKVLGVWYCSDCFDACTYVIGGVLKKGAR